MKISIKKRTLAAFAQLMIAALIASVIFMGPVLTGNFAAAANITNVTVLTRVNVTNTEPNITSVIVDDDSNSPASQIELTPLTTKKVYCNATVSDFNGWADINVTSVNATLYISSVGRQGNPDNNHRYVNDSCGACTSITATSALCECSFGLQYYTNDSANWICNVTLSDLGGTASSNQVYLNATRASSAVTVNKLLAINTSSLIDYGNLSVTQTSSEIVHNITNGGNINLNLSLRGFGGTNDSLDDAGNNLTMMCDYGNISIGYQRYALGSDNSGIAFNDMTILGNQTRRTNMSLPARINDAEFGIDRNSTLWRLQVPMTVGGICNGTIIFGAIDGEQ